jgi:hypothetical protein
MSTEKSAAATSSGIGLSGILTIIFVLAKLLGKISWSWWWVVSPLWISTLITLGIIGGVLVIAALAAIFAALLEG